MVYTLNNNNNNNNKMGMLKIGVFYDGNYFLHVSNYYSHYSDVHRRLSLPGFHKFLCHAVARAEGVAEETCRVVTGHYFRGRLSAQDASHRCKQLYNDRVFDDVLMSVGVKTHYLPLRTRMGRKEEKGIDVWLALEAYERALHYHLDVVVLVSSDGEYVPLIRKLHTLGVRVLVLNWEFDYLDESGRQVSTRTSSDLLSEVTYALDADSLIREGLSMNNPVVEGLFMQETEDVEASDEEYYEYEDDSEGNLLANGYGSSFDFDGSLGPKILGKVDLSDGREDYRVSLHPDEEVELDNLIMPRYRSRIVNLISKSGYGFIEHTPSNLFFYHKDLLGIGIADLEVGDEVEFSIGAGKNGNDVAAKQVMLIREAD